MAIERKQPDALLIQTNLVGSVTDIDEDPNIGDSNWLTATDETLDTICRVSFQTPTGNPTAGPGFQEFKFLARLTSAGSSCSYSVDLYEDGVSVATIATGTITDTTGQLITAVWDASALGTADGSLVEAQITVTAAVDTTGEIGAVEWNVTYTATTSVSIREQIVSAFATQLENLTTANGYAYTVATVARARREFIATELPAIGVFDGDEAQADDYGDIRADMQIRAEFHNDAGAINRSTVMNRMMANLEKGILSQDTTYGGIADGLRITGVEMRLPADDDSTLLTIAVVATITYHKTTGDPYSQP